MNDNLKEYIIHLRSIQFLLLLSCFAIFITSAIGIESDAQIAEKQLDKIYDNISKNNNYNQDQWLIKYIDNLVKQDREQSGRVHFNALKCISNHNKDKPNQEMYYLAENWLFNIREEKDDYCGSSHAAYSQRPFRASGYNNLSELKAAWNTLLKDLDIIIVDQIAPNGYIHVALDPIGNSPRLESPTYKLSSVSLLHNSVYKPYHYYSDRNIFLHLNKLSDYQDLLGQERMNEFKDYEFCLSCRDTFSSTFKEFWLDTEIYDSRYTPSVSAFVIIPVKIKKKTILGNTLFKEFFGFVNGFRKFEESYPELNMITKPYQGLAFDKISLILKAEAKRSEEKFEFLGTKIPSNDIAKWGPFIIISIQLYLLLHLVGFEYKTDENELSSLLPWLGIYQGWEAKSFMIASIIGIPIFVIAFQLYILIKQHSTTWLIVISCILLLNLIISIFCVCEISKLRTLFQNSSKD